MTKINEFKEKQRSTQNLLVKSVVKGVTQKGSPYLSLVLQDNTGTIDGKFWDASEKDMEETKPGHVELVSFEVLDYNNALQLRVHSIKDIDQEPIDLSEYVMTSPVEIEELKFKENQISLNKGRTRKLEYSISPDNASNKNVTWSSSDPNIVTVDQDGNITGVNEGSAYVFAIANGSNALVYPLIGDFCIVNVTDTDIKVSEISFYRS